MKVLVLPDLHLPASSPELIRWAARIQDKFKPHKVIQLGDLIDAKAWSRFPKSSTDDSAALEWEKTVKQAELLYKYFPKLQILEGNHCGRLMKKALIDAGSPPQLIRPYYEALGFKGWDFHLKSSPLVVDAVAYIHGDEIASPLALLATRMGMSTVRGHTHFAGIIYTRLFTRQVFAMESGALIDETHAAFGYASKNPKRCWIGVSTVEDGENPQLISY